MDKTKTEKDNQRKEKLMKRNLIAFSTICGSMDTLWGSAYHCMKDPLHTCYLFSSATSSQIITSHSHAAKKMSFVEGDALYDGR